MRISGTHIRIKAPLQRKKQPLMPCSLSEALICFSLKHRCTCILKRIGLSFLRDTSRMVCVRLEISNLAFGGGCATLLVGSSPAKLHLCVHTRMCMDAGSVYPVPILEYKHRKGKDRGTSQCVGCKGVKWRRVILPTSMSLPSGVR